MCLKENNNKTGSIKRKGSSPGTLIAIMISQKLYNKMHNT